MCVASFNPRHNCHDNYSTPPIYSAVLHTFLAAGISHSALFITQLPQSLHKLKHSISPDNQIYSYFFSKNPTKHSLHITNYFVQKYSYNPLHLLMEAQDTIKIWLYVWLPIHLVTF